MRFLFSIVFVASSLMCMSVTSGNNSPLQQVFSDTIKQNNVSAEFIHARYSNTFLLNDIAYVLNQRQPARIHMGNTQQGRMIQAWYFPGKTDHRALVIGGVHGSELSSIEVANSLISKLLESTEAPYYTVIVIPSLFPDNAAMAANLPSELGSVKNIGRYSHHTAVDPNRQMPSPGESFNEFHPADHLERLIENENQYLLKLIQEFRPQRIANLHAIRSTTYGGIYADPRTDHLGMALGYDSDSSLAVDMAKKVASTGGNVAGNQLNKQPTALYYKDPTPVAQGRFQKRNMSGSSLKANRGSGVSMGTWGTTAIAGQANNRSAMRVITLEFPGAKRPQDYNTGTQRIIVQKQIDAFAQSILGVFLQDYHVEEEITQDI